MAQRVEIIISASDLASGQIKVVGSSLATLQGQAAGAQRALAGVGSGAATTGNSLRTGLGSALTGLSTRFNDMHKAPTIFRSVAGAINSELTSVLRMIQGVGVAMAVFYAIQLPGQIISTAIDAYAAYERLGLSLTNLVAVEKMKASGTERTIVVGQQLIEMTEKETKTLETQTNQLARLKDQLEDAMFKRETMTAQGEINSQKDARSERNRQQALRDTALAMKEQELRIQQLTARWGANGIDTLQAIESLNKLRTKYEDLQSPIDTQTLAVSKSTEAYKENEGKIASLQVQIGKLEGAVGTLGSKQAQLVDVTKKVKEGQMSMAEAYEAAKDRAKELVEWTEKVAIFSPFRQEGVQVALQQAMGYGIASDKAQKLVQAITDYGAATGRTEAQLQEMGFAFGQVYAKGVLRAEEMNRQLTNAGVSIDFMADALGITREVLINTMSEGKIAADDVLDGFIRLTDERFADAAKKQATSWAGIRSTMADITQIGLREFFTGIFQTVQPYFVTFLEGWPELQKRIRAVGDELGSKVAGGLAKVSALMQVFREGGTKSLIGALGFSPAVTDIIIKTLDALRSVADFVSANFAPTMNQIGAIVMPLVSQALAFVNEHFEEFKWGVVTFLAVMAGDAGIAVLVGLATMLFSLISPLIILASAAGLLAAAWAGNWGDIQGKAAAAWAVIGPILADLVAWLQLNVPAAIAYLTPIIKGFLNEISERWDEHGDSIMLVLGTVWETTIRGFEVMFVGIQVIWAGFNAFWQANGEWITAFFEMVFKNVVTILKAAWNAIGLVTALFAAAFQGDWYQFGVKLRELWDNAWNTMVTVLGRAAETLLIIIGEMIRAAWDRITSYDWGAAGRSIIDGLVQGISKGWDFFLNTIRRLVEAAWDVISGFFGITSPSKLMFEAGQNIVQGLSMGIQSGTSGLLGAIRSQLGQVLTLFQEWGGVTQGEMEKFAQSMGNVPLWVVQHFVRGFGRLPTNVGEWNNYLDRINVRDAGGRLWFPDTAPANLPPATFNLGTSHQAGILKGFAAVGNELGGVISAAGSAFRAAMERIIGGIDASVVDRAARSTDDLTKALGKLLGSAANTPAMKRVFDVLGKAGDMLGEMASKADIVGQVKDLVGGFESLGIALPPDLLASIIEISKAIGGPFEEAIRSFLALSQERSALKELEDMLGDFQLGSQLAAAVSGMLAAGLKIPQSLLDMLRNLPRTPGGYLDYVIGRLFVIAEENVGNLRRTGPGTVGGDRGVGLPMLAGGSGVVNNYNLSLNSRQESAGVVADFSYLRQLSRGW